MTDVAGELIAAVVLLAGIVVGVLIARGLPHREQPQAPQPLPERKVSDIGDAILEALPDGVIVVNSSGVILHANRAMSNMFALPYLEGLPVENLIPEDLRDRHRQHVQEYFRGPKSRPMGIGLALEAVRGGGQRFPVDISLAPIQRAGGSQAVAVVRDMTARHAAAKGHP